MTTNSFSSNLDGLRKLKQIDCQSRVRRQYTGSSTPDLIRIKPRQQTPPLQHKFCNWLAKEYKPTILCNFGLYIHIILRNRVSSRIAYRGSIKLHGWIERLFNQGLACSLRDFRITARHVVLIRWENKRSFGRSPSQMYGRIRTTISQVLRAVEVASWRLANCQKIDKTCGSGIH